MTRRNSAWLRCIRLGLAGELATGDTLLSELLDEIGEDVEAAIEELREVAAGIYSHVLSDHGVAAALRQGARACGGAVSISSGGVGRYPAGRGRVGAQDAFTPSASE